eukprot:TRINITY_DN1548_c0_g1_i1.p2 TRINITY_DN1548_c0_g1~~TRINITY_DN1548_c0_g1_i1.p2  ORF type:complete len:164 (+),score=47.28 TRINITY_DN1548_c0_g1_i1:83-574(+)
MAVSAGTDYDHLFKILLIGDSGVGKSSILLRFSDDSFEEDMPCTIGVDFKIKYVDHNGKCINMTIWDTAGQEKFRSLTSSYYRGTHGICLVYDVSKRESFAHLNQWLNEVELYTTNPDAIKMLIGNKVDKVRGTTPQYRAPAPHAAHTCFTPWHTAGETRGDT